MSTTTTTAPGWLAAGGADWKVRIYNTSAGQAPLLQTLDEATRWARSVDYHPDGTRLAAGGSDGRVRIYNTSAGQASLLQTLSEATNNSKVLSVDYNHDGTRLAAGEWDGKVRIYSTGTVDTEKSVESRQGSNARLPCSYAGRHFTVFWKKGEGNGEL